MSSCRSLSETSAQTRYFFSPSWKSRLQWGMICSCEQISILCSNMISKHPLNRSWSLIIRLRMIRRGVLSPWTNRGKVTKGETPDNSSKWDSPPPALSISYERLLLQICDLSDFLWSEPIKIDLARRDRNRRCSYHKDHDHTTEQCKNLHYLVEKLIKVEHPKQYFCMTNG